MQVSASNMYGLSIYKSQFQPTKAPQFNPSTTNIVDSDAIKVVRHKESVTKEAQAIGADNTFKENSRISASNKNTKITKSIGETLQKVQKDIFSPTENTTKQALSLKLQIDDFSTKVLKIVHYRDAFAENMQALLHKAADTQQNTVANKQSIMRKSVYA